MKIKIDGEKYHVSEVYTASYLPEIETEEGPSFYLAKDSESAGQAAYKYWEDMAQDDPGEFACIIGNERLIQWRMGQSDGYGISSCTEFFERNAEVPEENFASYDFIERTINKAGEKLIEELGFVPTVAYRYN